MLWSLQLAEGARQWDLLGGGRSVCNSCGFSVSRRYVFHFAGDFKRGFILSAVAARKW
jgi:hypothetical protein